MSDALPPLVDWLVRHTYAVVLVGAAIDATGVPFPGRLLLVVAGAIAAGGQVDPLVLIVLGVAGTIAGDHLWYFAGALGSARLLRLYCRLTFSSRRCQRRTQDWFRRHGPFTILIGRFVAGVRLLAWPLARAHGVGYATFLLLDVAGALLWSGLWIGLGWLLGERWPAASEHMVWGVPAFLLVGTLALGGSRLWHRLRHGAASVRFSGPTGSGGRASRGWPGDPRARPRP
jgi:membrane protein DedA with SNARE-associated domain